MLFTIFVTALALTTAKVIENCTGVGINGINHEKETLKSNIDSPYQLALDHDSGILFFSFSTPTDKDDPFKSAFLNLKTNHFSTIPGITGGFANVVDNKNHIVYLGGNNAIYTFDFDKKIAQYFAAKNFSIWQMFYKDQLYFTNYPDETAYYIDGETVNDVPQLIGKRALLVALDKNDNMFISNASGLYCYEKEKSKIISIGEYNPNGFATDPNGKLFFSTPEGIYSIDDKLDVQKIANIENVYGMAIESDGSFIYSDSDSIIRLKPTKFKCVSEQNHKGSF